MGKANFQAIKDEFRLFSEDFVASYDSNSDIDYLWGSFKQKCVELLNKWVPSKNASVRFHQPWINTSLKDCVVTSNVIIILLVIPTWRVTG